MGQKKSLRFYLLLGAFACAFSFGIAFAQAATDTRQTVIRLPSGSDFTFDDLATLAAEKDCEAISKIRDTVDVNDWNALAITYVTTNKPRLDCLYPIFYALMDERDERVNKMRARYLESLASITDALMYESSLDTFTRGGIRCLKPEEVLKVADSERLPEGFPDGWEPEGWLADLCRDRLPRTGLVPIEADRYQFKSTNLFRDQYASEGANPAWLLDLVQTLGLPPQQNAVDLDSLFKEPRTKIFMASWWHTGRHDKSLIYLDLGFHGPDPSSLFDPVYWVERSAGAKVLLVISPRGYSIAAVPSRFWDDSDNEIVRVTDLDSDGNLEIWWAHDFDKCQENESDLERDVDCRASVAELGEIRDNVLTFFSESPPVETEPDDSLYQAAESFIAGMNFPPPTQGKKDRPCNLGLLGSILEKKLDIRYRRRQKEGDVIDVVCKPHPVHSNRTIVALFHDITDDDASAHTDYDAAFMVAVVDANSKRMHAYHHSIVRGDATTRFDEFSLSLDTARYYLTDDIRALGVRMNISHYPRHAEGGETGHLSLFVESDDQLTPVLSNLPMNLWRVVDVRAENPEVVTADLILKMSGSRTEGWRDIEVIAKYNRENDSLRKLGKLRAVNQRYSLGPLNLQETVW